MYYHFKIRKEKTGFSAQGVELKQCITQAETMEELHANMEEVLDLFLSEPIDSTVKFPRPKKEVAGKDIVPVRVDPQIAFAIMLRQERLRQGLTQRKAADLLDIKNLSQYQKLEKPEGNPGLVTLARIKKTFPNIIVDEAL